MYRNVKHLFHMHYPLNSISNQNDQGSSDVNETKESVSRYLGPLFRVRANERGRCIACMEEIHPDERSSIVNNSYCDYKAHEECLKNNPGIPFEDTKNDCSFCKRSIDRTEIVVSTCVCQKAFHIKCALYLVAQRNKHIVRFGFFAGFLPCFGCNEIYFDMMNPFQRYFLLLYRDYGENTCERGLFTKVYNYMYPHASESRDLYFRIVFSTNEKCWAVAYDPGFIKGFQYRTFKDFILRDDIAWKVPAKPVFDISILENRYPVTFPNIRNIPYTNNHQEEQFYNIDQTPFRKRVSCIPHHYYDDVGQLVHEEACDNLRRTDDGEWMMGDGDVSDIPLPPPPPDSPSESDSSPAQSS